MQKFVTICLQCQDVTHGAVEEHLSDLLAEGWRITSVSGTSSAPASTAPVVWLAVVLEQVSAAPNAPMVAFPASAIGNPIEASDISVDEDTLLEIGTRVLAFSQGRWWRAEVVGFEDDRVKIHFPGWGSEWDVVVAREELQVDLHPTDEE